MKSKKALASGSVKLPGKHFPIVAIGASAGGLEAVSQLLKNLSPDTGMAYVYIQHLDPKHKSLLTQILSKETPMRVQEAKNLMRIAPNHVYIIPPGKDMLIMDGALKLESRSGGEEIHMTIDKFFLSLAEKQKQSIIGIVLSGNASDGTLGLKAIKLAGGFTFVQDDTAKFDSMPKSAIAEGAADMVLSPEKIAQELGRLSKNTSILQKILGDNGEEDGKRGEVPADEEEEINDILLLLKKSTGVDFSHYKKNTIRRRIIRRMVLHKLTSLKKYYQYLKQHLGEVNNLYQDLLINVTSFFRNPVLMEYLKKALIPRILKNKTSGDSIRIWIPACSTGEEAYSIAILLMEVLGEKAVYTGVQIFATDLSEAAITKARQGLYSKSDLAGVSPKRLKHFFIREDNGYRVVKSIRNLCVFAPHNLFRDPPFSQLDLISCCNLMIYLDGVLQKRAIATFHYALNNNGYLILGTSETPNASPNLFIPVDKRLKIFARKKDISSQAAFTASYKSYNAAVIEKFSPVRQRREKSANKGTVRPSSLEKIVENVLLDRYVPACVVINKELEILQFRGSTGLFLEPSPGRASLNLLKMARPGLNMALRDAIHKVIKSGEPYKKSGLEVKHKNNAHVVNIEVVPLKSEGENHFLIIFEEVAQPLIPLYTASSKSKHIKQLEQELAASREDMRSIIEEQEAVNEELQSANEEIVSSNEELHTINEELETSKEELESSNEELLMVNRELQVRNEQLAESNSYSEMILATIREGVIVMDNDLRVKSANKTFYKIFNIKKEEAEGKLIYKLGNSQWDIPELHKLLDEIIHDNIQFHGYQVKHVFPEIGEKVLLLNAQRITQKALQKQVILLAIEDITEHVAGVKIIVEREEWLRNITNNAPVMIWLAGTDGKRTFFNKTWLEFTGRNMEQEKENGWIEDVYPDDKESFLKSYRYGFEHQKPFRIEYRLRRYDGEYRWTLSQGKPTYDVKGAFIGFTGICFEIHERIMIKDELEKKVKERTHALYEANANLERSNDELQRFAYVASHDLQEPLRKIITFSDRLETRFKAQLPAEAGGYVDKVVSSAERMTGLIDDLLNFSKVSTTNEKFAATDLNKEVKNVLKDFDLLISQKKARIELENLPVVEAVPVQIRQLFQNLIGNALKFSTAKKVPEISIKAAKSSPEELNHNMKLNGQTDYYKITVQDNGIGFKPKFAEQIFVIFQRLNDKKSYPGSGIGLALCRKIVSNHNGNIYAESKPGQGASFHIILPKKQVRGGG